MCINSHFFLFVALLSLGACDFQKPIFSDEELNFFQSKAHSDQQQIFTLSNQVYSGSQKCPFDSQCMDLCHKIYSLENSLRKCKKLKAQQVYQIEKLYSALLEKDLSHLESVNVFDLKVFFSVGAEPLFQIFKSLDLVSSKDFFKWIALNWQVAQVFQEEDEQLLFLRIFLNRLADSPINSLKEPIQGDRTFIELAWLKQNDFALLWLYDYFHKNQCAGVESRELENCAVAQYCLASDSFKEDVLEEIIELNVIRDLIEGEGSYTNFKSFCSDFCSSQKGQNYCG